MNNQSDAKTFLAHLHPVLQRKFFKEQHLLVRLRDILSSALQQWPRLTLQKPLAIQFLAERFPQEVELDKVLTNWKITDLLLCLACIRCENRAVAMFENRFWPIVRGILTGSSLDFSQILEFEQQLRVQLFLGLTDKKPLLATYQGIGKLENWLRVVIKRMLRRWNFVEQRASGPTIDNFENLVVLTGTEIELYHAKHSFSQAFRQCFISAFAQLTDEEKLLLCYRFRDGLRLEKIAAIYNVRHPTISRRIKRTCNILLDLTRNQLVDELGINREEFADMMFMVQSRLGVTLSILFKNQLVKPPNPPSSPKNEP